MKIIENTILRFKILIYPLYVKSKLLFKQPRYHSKVFCIGYQKTGTTSVGKAIESLGYSHSSWYKPIFKQYRKDNIDKVIKRTAYFDSFDDLPWSDKDFIPILDKKFPNSKFINLVRNENEWKKSYKRYFNKSIEEVEEAYADYLKHQEFVSEYFKNKPDQLLTINVKDSNSFQKIADFLGEDVPSNLKLPHINKS
jgi:hypothetical protein